MRKFLSYQPEADFIAHQLWVAKDHLNLEGTVTAIRSMNIKREAKAFATGVAVTAIAASVVANVILSNKTNFDITE